MTTLFDATLALAKILGNVVDSTATGGSATTLVDTARLETDLYFKGGTLWFKSGNRANTSAKVTDYDLATKTFTFLTGGAVAAAVTYAAAPQDFPREVLIQAINEAVRELPLRDVALETVVDQNEYTLPTGVYNVKHVEVATRKTAPLEYQANYAWQELEGKLVFDPLSYPVEAGYIIRLTYLPARTALDTDDDALSGVDHLDAIKWKAAEYALRWKVQRLHGDERQHYTTLLNEAIVNARQMAAKWPVPVVVRAPRHAGW